MEKVHMRLIRKRCGKRAKLHMECGVKIVAMEEKLDALIKSMDNLKET